MCQRPGDRIMARKVTCPHCNSETYDTPSCGRCGKSLRDPGEENTVDKVRAKLSFKYGLFERAETVEDKFAEIVLAQFKSVRSDADESTASTKLVVKKDRRQYVYTSIDKAPTLLGEGQYSL